MEDQLLQTRILVNDRLGDVLTDEVLLQFIYLANRCVPYIAASLFAHSKGLNTQAEFFLRFCGGPNLGELEEKVSELRRLKE